MLLPRVFIQPNITNLTAMPALHRLLLVIVTTTFFGQVLLQNSQRIDAREPNVPAIARISDAATEKWESDMPN